MNVKKILLTGGLLIIGIWYIFRPIPALVTPKPAPGVPLAAKNMILTSSAFANEEKIPVDYTCDGKKVNPPLAWSGIPDGTKSLAIIVDDPDAPTGTFNHWVIWNIHPSVTEIATGSVPQESQEGTNSAGRIGFTPPCPPSGSHRYFFTLYALDTTIGLDGKAKKDEIVSAMNGHIIEQTNLIGTYGR